MRRMTIRPETLRVAFLLITVVFASGCSGDDPVDPPVPARITISPATATLVSLAETGQLTAAVYDQHGQVMTAVPVAWASRDPSVASVSGSGLVTAVGNGTVTVEASAGDAVGSAVVTVDQKPSEVTVSPEAATIPALGDTVRLSAEALDANGHVVQDAEFAWTSGDESVATVDGAGLVTAVANGGARVTAAAGEVSGSAELTVRQRPSEVTVSPEAATIPALEDTVRLSAEALDANGHVVQDAEFAWTSGDESVATVDGAGLVTAVANGSAMVTAVTTDEAMGSAMVTVRQRAVTMRLLPPTRDTLLTPDTMRLSVEAHDANGHSLANAELFDWSSSDDALATVDESGLVAAVGAGSVRITAVEGAAGLSRTAELWVVETRAVLEIFYDALGGDDWDVNANWGTDAPLGTWYGVTTDDLGRLTQIDLTYNGLKGELPPEINLLYTLETMCFGRKCGGEAAERYASGAYALQGTDNDISGAIPSMTALVDITWLDLSGNNLTGSIPSEFGHLEELEVLQLHDNQLTGSIPSGLGNLEYLWVLNLSNNQLSGSIPSELGNLANMKWMYLQFNSLTGSIPSTFGNLDSVDDLTLSNNQLSGSVPSELGNLDNLGVLNLSHNTQLSGALPQTLTNLSLRQFFWDFTSLCSPNNPTFQAWLDSVEGWGMGVCGS